MTTNHPQIRLLIGLPTNLPTAVVEQVNAGLRTLKGAHEFASNGRTFRFEVPDMKGSIATVPQPIGAYTMWRYDADLRPVIANTGRRVLVIDIGTGTLDVAAIQESPESGGRLVPKLVPGSTLGADLGVHWLLSSLAGDSGRSVAEIDAELRSGRIKPSPEKLASWANQVMTPIRDTGIKLRSFDAILVTGGGVQVLGDALRLRMIQERANMVIVDDPFLANVRGYWKHGSSAPAPRA